MKLKEITFHFENCDYLTIDGKYIGNFHVGDIKTVIQRIACNSIRQMDIVHTFAIEIHKDANKEHYPLGIKEDKQSVFDRLTAWDDITSIEFTLVEQYENDTLLSNEVHYNYFVHWVGDNDVINLAQNHYISNQGHLYIVISEDKSIGHFFNYENIDNAYHMDFVCSMYEIGEKYSNKKESFNEKLENAINYHNSCSGNNSVICIHDTECTE